jgi:hypothetical protein
LINVAPEISGNTFSGMTVGVTASNSNPESLSLNFQNNTFDNAGTGISLTGAIDATINGNQFKFNDSAISLAGSDVALAISSNFHANNLSLSFLDDAALFTASPDLLTSSFFTSTAEGRNLVGLPATISQSGVIPAMSVTYKVVSTITVPNSIELSLAPGVTLGFDADVGVSVDPGGSLIVGESSGGDSVVFTKLAASSWSGISVAGDAELYNCRVEYALTGLTINAGSVPVSNCVITNNDFGILVSGAGTSVTVTNSTISLNAGNGINRASGEISISQSYITENGGFGIYNADSGSYVIAENNNWGVVSQQYPMHQYLIAQHLSTQAH